MFRFICILASFFTMSFLLLSCRPGPETLKEQAVQSITAKNLEEYVVGSTLQKSQYMPGLEQMLRDEYQAMCKKIQISMDKPFYDILRSGFFDSVDVNVKMNTVKRSSNLLLRDDNLFRVTFNCRKKFPDGALDFCFIFIVADTPMGRGILNWQMTVDINGREEISTNYKNLLFFLSCIEHNHNGLIGYYNTFNPKRSKQNSKIPPGKK